jgi:hypothetical protein
MSNTVPLQFDYTSPRTRSHKSLEPHHQCRSFWPVSQKENYMCGGFRQTKKFRTTSPFSCSFRPSFLFLRNRGSTSFLISSFSYSFLPLLEESWLHQFPNLFLLSFLFLFRAERFKSRSSRGSQIERSSLALLSSHV